MVFWTYRKNINIHLRIVIWKSNVSYDDDFRILPMYLTGFHLFYTEYNVAVFVTNQMTADPGAGMT